MDYKHSLHLTAGIPFPPQTQWWKWPVIFSSSLSKQVIFYRSPAFILYVTTGQQYLGCWMGFPCIYCACVPIEPGRGGERSRYCRETAVCTEGWILIFMEQKKKKNWLSFTIKRRNQINSTLYETDLQIVYLGIWFGKRINWKTLRK